MSIFLKKLKFFGFRTITFFSSLLESWNFWNRFLRSVQLRKRCFRAVLARKKAYFGQKFQFFRKKIDNFCFSTITYLFDFLVNQIIKRSLILLVLNFLFWTYKKPYFSENEKTAEIGQIDAKVIMLNYLQFRGYLRFWR